jgi:[amino group carrier protein]-6-phospho-L-2-aminoadipate/5-phospho-L-glutamate reductase
VEAVRGVLSTVHAFVSRPVDEKELWRTYRAAYGSEPFVRIVHETEGIHREPEPKVLAGTNFCDLGFATDPHADRVVLLSAIDNLGKGAAGNAVQCLNVRAGFPESTGLGFLGLHPV